MKLGLCCVVFNSSQIKILKCTNYCFKMESDEDMESVLLLTLYYM